MIRCFWKTWVAARPRGIALGRRGWGYRRLAQRGRTICVIPPTPTTAMPSPTDYTPFELIDYSDTVLKHEVKVHVDAPIDKCYRVWSDRLNWLQWFDMIEEVCAQGGPVHGLRHGFRCRQDRSLGRMQCQVHGVALQGRGVSRHWLHPTCTAPDLPQPPPLTTRTTKLRWDFRSTTSRWCPCSSCIAGVRGGGMPRPGLPGAGTSCRGAGLDGPGCSRRARMRATASGVRR